MSIGVLFWVLIILSVIFGGWSSWPDSKAPGFVRSGGSLLTLVLIALLGWRVFGAALHN